MKNYMNLRIEWTHTALQSLEEVFEYTFEEFGDTLFIEYVRNVRMDDLTVWERLI